MRQRTEGFCDASDNSTLTRGIWELATDHVESYYCYESVCQGGKQMGWRVVPVGKVEPRGRKMSVPTGPTRGSLRSGAPTSWHCAYIKKGYISTCPGWLGQVRTGTYQHCIRSSMRPESFRPAKLAESFTNIITMRHRPSRRSPKSPNIMSSSQVDSAISVDWTVRGTQVRPTKPFRCCLLYSTQDDVIRFDPNIYRAGYRPRSSIYCASGYSDHCGSGHISNISHISTM